MAGPLIELTTLIEQPTIKINGKLYPILHPDQLGVIGFQRLVGMGSKVSALLKKSEPDDADVAELDSIIVDLTDRIMINVPDDVRTLLTESQRIAVAEVFMTLPRVQTRTARKWTKAKKAKKAASRSAGLRQPYDASTSTAGTQPDG